MNPFSWQVCQTWGWRATCSLPAASFTCLNKEGWEISVYSGLKENEFWWIIKVPFLKEPAHSQSLVFGALEGLCVERYCWDPVFWNSSYSWLPANFSSFGLFFKSMHMVGKTMWVMFLPERAAQPRQDIKDRCRSCHCFFLRMKEERDTVSETGLRENLVGTKNSQSSLWGHNVTHRCIILGKLTKPDCLWDHTATGLSAILTAGKIGIDLWTIDYVCHIVIASSHKTVMVWSLRNKGFN